jgi:hypothetical protein
MPDFTKSEQVIILILILIIILYIPQIALGMSALLISGSGEEIVGGVSERIVDKPPPVFLTPDMEKMEDKDAYKVKAHLHIGQLKLGLGTLCFPTEYANEGDVIVYAGAAPCINLIPILRILKPLHLQWLLIDPRGDEFDKRLYKYDNVRIFKEFFTNDMADELSVFNTPEKITEEFKKKYFTKEMNESKGFKGKMLFISDIRTNEINGVSYSDLPDKQKSEVIYIDMNMQKEWVMRLKPYMASFKFRFPFTKGKTTYFKGDILLQAYAPVRSTEARLFTNCKEMVEYDHIDHEQWLMKYNDLREHAIYPNCHKNLHLNHKLDTCRFYMHIKDAFEKTGEKYDDKKIEDTMYEIFRDLHLNEFAFRKGWRLSEKKIKQYERDT